MTESRAAVASSFTLVKGLLIDETYRIFAGWDLTQTRRENLDRVRAENPIGAPTTTWLRDVAKVINRRFAPDGRDRALVVLAQQNCPLDTWRPIFLWHVTRDEFLLRDFLTHWLFRAFEEGTFSIQTRDLHAYLIALPSRGATTEHAWSENTIGRVASALLKSATELGLLQGRQRRTFAGYHLPDAAFLYLLHAMSAETPNARRLIESPDWRLFLMRPSDVEREILRLHQYRRLHYEAAGSLAQLTLPAANALAYAEHLESAA